MEPEKKTPEEEKKLAPAAEQKDEPKPEEKPADDKPADDNGTAEKTPVINKQTAQQCGLKEIWSR